MTPPDKIEDDPDVWRSAQTIDIAKSGHYVGDCRELLKQLPDACVQTCITSPPYWGLRDYGEVEQIGLEETPEKYVDELVCVFREVHRVLRDDGTLWLNLGDTYSQGGRGGIGARSTLLGGRHNQNESRSAREKLGRARPQGYKPKDLLGLPWMVAFALRADGWYLRADIVWHKPNPMPEAVTDRPTKAHEYIFLLAKSERYYYDGDAVREPVTGGAKPRGSGVNAKAELDEPGSRQNTSWSGSVSAVGRRRRRSGNKERKYRADHGGSQDSTAHQAFGVPWEDTNGLRNRRSVWTVQSHCYHGAHFATFPPKLIEPCVLAGSRPRDIVLDPFFGSGTTGEVAEKHGRRWIGFDLGYETLAKTRTAQRSMMADLSVPRSHR